MSSDVSLRLPVYHPCPGTGVRTGTGTKKKKKKVVVPSGVVGPESGPDGFHKPVGGLWNVSVRLVFASEVLPPWGFDCVGPDNPFFVLLRSSPHPYLQVLRWFTDYHPCSGCCSYIVVVVSVSFVKRCDTRVRTSTVEAPT